MLMRNSVSATYCKLKSKDPDEVAAYYGRTLFPARVRPVDGSSLIEVSDCHHDAGLLSIWTGACPSGMEVFPSGGADNFVIYVPIAGDLEIAAGTKVLRSSPTSALIADASTYARVKLSRGRSHFGIGVSKSEIIGEIAARLDGPVVGRVEFAPNCDVTQGMGASLASMAGALWSGLEAEGALPQMRLAMSLLSQSIVALLVDALPHSHSDLLASRRVATASPSHIRCAIDFMRASAQRPISILEIAEVCQVSVRTLQHGFQRFQNCSPMEYLRQIRLEAAHRDLTNPDRAETIADIARRWGFLHLGRFAAQYRTQYGRMPSKVFAR